MKEIILREIRDNNRIYSKNSDELNKTMEGNLLLETLETLCNFTDVAKHTGLLGLEEAAENLEDLKNGKYLKEIALLIVDGTDPEILEEIMITKYFSLGLSGYEAIQFLMMLYGCLAMQAGEHKIRIVKRLLAMLPEELADEYIKNEEAKAEKKGNDDFLSELEIKYMSPLYSGDVQATPEDDCYYLLKVTDHTIRMLDDLGTQLLIKKANQHDLLLLMKGASGDCRRHILDNMSKHLAAMTTDDYNMLGPVKLKDIASSTRAVFEIIVTMIRHEEIILEDSAGILLFKKIFDEGDEAATNSFLAEARFDMLTLMREYSTGAEKLVY